MDRDVRKLPIGVQSFEKIINDDYKYVDKTADIYRLVHTGGQFFLSRPRRFGKSLLLSTIGSYWEGKKELFAKLKIEELEEDNADAWRKYPVFYFDFNGKNYSQPSALEESLNEHLVKWESQYNISPKAGEALDERFRNLLYCAYEQTGLGCVILVDEYDKPLLEVMSDSSKEEHNKNVFKGFFGTLKSYDKYLRFVFITGVTKFNKVSIFSDLNQLDDISLSPKYATICGITNEELITSFKDEIYTLAASQNMSVDSCITRLRANYDGYHFGHDSDGVYNPFSILKCFGSDEFGQYWFESGTPSFLVKRLKELNFDVRQFADMSLYATEKRLQDYRGDNPDPIPLLYQTGYLTIKDYDSKDEYYTLGFPNDEVKYGFLDSLMPEYTPAVNTESGKDILSIRMYVDNGDIDSIRDAFVGLFASIPYTVTDKAPYEQYFQTVIYLIFVLLGKYVHCEVHSSRGRADCIVETARYVYIFEFKRDRTAKEALEQIEDNGYALMYKADRRAIYRIGVNFDSESRNITEWQVLVN